MGGEWLAFFAPDNLPRQVQAGQSDLDELQVDQTLVLLVSYSLTTVSTQDVPDARASGSGMSGQAVAGRLIQAPQRGTAASNSSRPSSVLLRPRLVPAARRVKAAGDVMPEALPRRR
ncbi:hypothetical protein [Nonomuraea sp. NPDC050310]|uniref:hypothetical protein n=1 Tax=Nonomuraea sp. NPDC050310 TaxID=3154935 RepID=UPI0033CFC037